MKYLIYQIKGKVNGAKLFSHSAKFIADHPQVKTVLWQLQTFKKSTHTSWYCFKTKTSLISLSKNTDIVQNNSCKLLNTVMLIHRGQGLHGSTQTELACLYIKSVRHLEACIFFEIKTRGIFKVCYLHWSSQECKSMHCRNSLFYCPRIRSTIQSNWLAIYQLSTVTLPNVELT